MNDDLKEQLLTWYPGQDEESLREEALARITDLEARLAAAEANVNRLREGEARLSLLLNETAQARDAAEAGEDALAEALHFYAETRGDPNMGPWGVNSTDFGKVAMAALAAYEARRKGK